MWDQHVIVVSHRRSGTHLTIDAIRNNFAKYRVYQYINLDRILHPKDNKQYLTVEQMREKLDKGPRVIKTHLLPSAEVYGGKAEQELIKEVFSQAKKIYIARDGKDVMVSLKNYMKLFDQEVGEMSFGDFLRGEQRFDPIGKEMSRPKFWQFHISSWLEQPWGKMLFLRFDNLRGDFVGTLDRVAAFIGEPRDQALTNIIQTGSKSWWTKLLKKLGIKNRRRGKQITSIAFRKGTVGQSKEIFDESDVEFFDKETPNRLELLDKIYHESE